MTSSFSKKVQFDRLPDDRRLPFPVRWPFRGGFPTGSDVVREVADVPEVATGEGMPRSMLNSIGNTFTAVFYK